MPVDTHLQWQEIRDFTGGLWTRNSQLMPPNALQQMDDCFPAPGGGLKAWFKATSFTTTGIGDTSLEKCRGLFAHENIDGAGNNDNYCWTWKASDNKLRLYRLNEPGGDVSWHLVQTFAAGTDPGMIHAVAYNDHSLNTYMVYSIGASAGTDSGTWYFRYADGAISHISTLGSYAFNYQSRICFVDGSNIHFSDAGLFTNIATNIAPVDINEGQPNIMFVATFSPGDLLVFKEGAPIYLVEGDLNSYTVRQMNGSKPVQIGGHNVVRGPQGVIFRVGSDGVYETPDGSMITPLSAAISQQEWTNLNPIAWHNHWLFCSGNGRVFDYDSHAWFNYTALTSNNDTVFTLSRLGGFFFADNATNFTINKVIPHDGRTDNRAESYTIKTAPLRDSNGRQTEIRAVQVYARSFNGATSTVAITVNGVTQTLACDSSGRGGLTFYFLARKEELDITMTAASNASGVCAPDVEVIRFAGQPGHFLRQVADVG